MQRKKLTWNFQWKFLIYLQLIKTPNKDLCCIRLLWTLLFSWSNHCHCRFYRSSCSSVLKYCQIYIQWKWEGETKLEKKGDSKKAKRIGKQISRSKITLGDCKCNFKWARPSRQIQQYPWNLYLSNYVENIVFL